MSGWDELCRATERSSSSSPEGRCVGFSGATGLFNCGRALTEVDRFCPQCGHPAAPSGTTDDHRTHTPSSAPPTIAARHTRVSGERRTVTAIFADVVDSTSL
ncbi:MAG: zinc-ribbon domain-containing protein, partial [Actinomycetota bacterium]